MIDPLFRSERVSGAGIRTDATAITTDEIVFAIDRAPSCCGIRSHSMPFILSQFRPHNRNHLHDRGITLCKASRAIRMGCITAPRLIAARCDRTSGCSSAMGFINTFHETEIF